MNEVKKKIIKTINESLMCVDTISDFFSYLKKHSIDVIPVGCNVSTRNFSAAGFLCDGVFFSGQSLGGQYTIPSIIKRGVSYDPERDFEKVKDSFLCYTREQQISFCKKISSNFELSLIEYLSGNQILKTIFYVEQHIRYKNKDIVLFYETNIGPSNQLSNTKLEITSPGCILLKKIELKENNYIFEFKYETIYSKKPCSISAYNSINEVLSNAVQFNNTDIPSEILDVMQCIYDKSFDSEFIFIKQKLISQDCISIVKVIPRFEKNHSVIDFVFNVDLLPIC